VRAISPATSSEGGSTRWTKTWTRTISTLSLTRPVTRIFSSVIRASGGGWLIVILGPSALAFGGSVRGAGATGVGSRRGGSAGGRVGSTGRDGSAGRGVGGAMTGGGAGGGGRLDSPVRPLGLPWALTKRRASGTYHRRS